MTELKHPAQTLLNSPDGFRIEIDEQRQRADIILAGVIDFGQSLGTLSP